jgi:hypothetical protein
MRFPFAITTAIMLLGYHDAQAIALPQSVTHDAASVLAAALSTANQPTPSSTPSQTADAVSALHALASLIASATPAPPPPQCEFTFQAVNQEGGGSPYQASINNWFFDFYITNEDGDHPYQKSFDAPSQGVSLNVGPGYFGMPQELSASASFDWTSFDWESCGFSFGDEDSIEGVVEPTDIDTNIVSTTTMKCSIKHAC